MSYFPTDIPFMSDEEKIENGIKIPYKKPEIIKGTDLVPVIRCKDCRHFLPPHACLHDDGMVTAQEDGFCSYGERKE